MASATNSVPRTAATATAVSQNATPPPQSVSVSLVSEFATVRPFAPYWFAHQPHGFARLEVKRGQLAFLEAQQFDARVAVAIGGHGHQQRVAAGQHLQQEVFAGQLDPVERDFTRVEQDVVREKVEALLFAETSTLGVRRQELARFREATTDQVGLAVTAAKRASTAWCVSAAAA